MLVKKLKYLIIYILVFFPLLLSQFVLGQSKQLEFKYLGAAGWVITQDSLVVLLDPYLTRLKLSSPELDSNDNRKTYGREDYFNSDKLVIDEVIQKADYIFIHHSHFDHLSDVPYIAKKTGAKVIGTESTCNILRAYGVPDDQLYDVKGGEDYIFKEFSVKIIPSLHSPLRSKHFFDSRTYKVPPIAPLKIDDFIEGGSLMYLIRFESNQLLTMGGMNFIEKEVTGLTPDIILMGVNFSKNEIYNYTERLLKATNYPKIVLPTHWDNFRVPYEFSQDKAIKDKIVPFIEEVKLVAPQSKVIVPTHLKSFTIRSSK